MTIDSLPAKVAAASANVAQATSKSTADGAQTDTDRGTPEAAFAAIFQQVSQQIAVEKAAPEAQAVDASPPGNAPNLPKLPDAKTVPQLSNLLDVPPPAVVNQDVAAEVTTDVAVKELPQTPKPKPVKTIQAEAAPQQLPAPPTVAKAAPDVPANLKKDAMAAEVDEPTPDVEPEHFDAPQKPEKHAATKCDAAVPPPPVQMQAVEVAKSAEAQDVQEVQPVIAESGGKCKRAQVEKPTLPKVKEVDEGQPRDVQPRKVEAEPTPVAIPEPMPEEMPVWAKDDPATPQEKQIAPAKLEFALPQPHVLQKEIEQPAPPPLPTQQAFIDANHPKIVSTIHAELLPNGGSVHIRMDPPELGALNVQIEVRDGIVTASFQTSNDQATRLLSHSLSQLRTTLESAGVSVEKLQVQQAPREHFNSNSRDSDRPAGQQAYERSAHDDRQRREMLQRMWRRLTVGRDMLDLVA